MSPTPQHLKQLVAERDLSVSTLSERTGIARMTLTRRLDHPDTFTVSELGRLATALDVAVLDLFPEDAA